MKPRKAGRADHPTPESGLGAHVIPFRRPPSAPTVSMLSDLKIGESALIVDLDLPDAVQNHLMHMGFVPEARVLVLRRAPAGDPTVYGIDGMEIALRRETASAIRVRPFTAGHGRDGLLEAAR